MTLSAFLTAADRANARTKRAAWRSGRGVGIGIGAVLAIASVSVAFAAPVVGEAAPALEATTSGGETISLADFVGKTVVLEWTNDGCPFVQKHYGSGNMQAMQAAVTRAGGIWISVISSAQGKQGYVDGTAADALNAERGASPTFVVLDPDGKVGRAYAARTTPHMFVIDGDGVLRYDGAIDNQPSASPAKVDEAIPYALNAFRALEAGEDVDPARTRPYGCSVKYGS